MEARARSDESTPGLDNLDEASHEDPPPRSTSEEQTPTRKKFTVSDDVVLLKAVNVVKPWEAPYGIVNGVMKSFDDVARMCCRTPGFISDKQGPALRTRFDKLVSMRASSTTEEYGERDVVLQDIVPRMDDWKERREAQTDQQKESGALLRQLAMREMEDASSDAGTASDDQLDAEAEATGLAIPKKRSTSEKKNVRKVTKR
ncbi:hypothetical protein BBJ28_00025004 [Nothophytophthora sp. Chile5]|nr:hypothetical protein BBJ28_00025004 [Nothophytophthora sp. Chile5]